MAPGWERVRYFTPDEFDSPDQPGSGERIDLRLVWILDAIRGSLGRPIRVTSGVRTVEHNRDVGGVAGSSHIAGLAVDVHVTDSATRWAIIAGAIKGGSRRIGIAKHFIHFDLDESKGPDVIWHY